MNIRLTEVCKSYDSKIVIDRLSLELPERGIIGLSGPSGCGKTTLLRLLAGLEQPDAGRLEGIDGMAVSMVFQEDRLLPWLTAADNLAVIEPDRAAVLQWLENVQLAEFAGYYPAAMSGGMKRRLALARALARPGNLLLLDEPFTGMDSELKAGLFSLIRQEGSQRLVVLVTHDEDDIRALGDSILVVEGPPLKILKCLEQ